MATSAIEDYEVDTGDEEEIYEVDPNHPARPMEVVFDEDGNHWLCDKGVDPKGDLAAQVGALRVGEKRLAEMVERNGRKEVLSRAR